MRTDADDVARVRDPVIELLLSHTATMTDEWCSRRRPRRQLGLRIGRSDQRRNGSIGSAGSSPHCASAMSTTPSATTSEPRPARPRSPKRHARRSTPDTFPERLRRIVFGDSSIDTTDYHLRFLPESRTRQSRSEVALYVTEATLGGRAPLATKARSVTRPIRRSVAALRDRRATRTCARDAPDLISSMEEHGRCLGWRSALDREVICRPPLESHRPAD